jgi:hypothetical protein
VELCSEFTVLVHVHHGITAQASWTFLDLQVGDVSWYHEVSREKVRVTGPEVQVGTVQGHQVLRRGQCPRR